MWRAGRRPPHPRKGCGAKRILRRPARHPSSLAPIRRRETFACVTPAKAGAQGSQTLSLSSWIPACAGMTRVPRGVKWSGARQEMASKIVSGLAGIGDGDDAANHRDSDRGSRGDAGFRRAAHPCLWNPFGGCSFSFVSPEYANKPVQPLDPEAALAAINAFRAENGRQAAGARRASAARRRHAVASASRAQLDRSLRDRRVDAEGSRRERRLSRQDRLGECRLGAEVVRRRAQLLEAKLRPSDQSAAAERDRNRRGDGQGREGGARIGRSCSARNSSGRYFALTRSRSSRPAIRNTRLVAMPRRWLPVACVTAPMASGAAKAVILPEKEKKPKNSVVLLGRAEAREQGAARGLDRAGGEPDQHGEGEIDLLARRSRTARCPEASARPAPRTARGSGRPTARRSRRR